MNKKISLIVVLIIIISFIVLLIFNKDNSYLKEITYNQFIEKIENKEDFILYFKQNGCSHCNKFTPVFENVLNDYKVNAYFINLSNISENENKKLLSSYSISGTPTVIFIRSGKELSKLYRIDGEKSKDIIIKKLKKAEFLK